MHKRITSIGSADECDIVLPGDDAAATHCHIHFDGRTYQLAAIAKARVLVNGKRRKRHELSERDEITIGATNLLFRLRDDVVAQHGGAERELGDDPAYQRLFEFASRLLRKYELSELLAELMDAVIAVTRADKGFLVLFEDNRPTVRVARNLRHENIDDAIDQLSDSIVAKVLRTRRPLIVSDALSDDEFANAKSIIKLNVLSVMCVPLMDQDSIIGLIYVGNDNVVELFEQSTLELLTVFAAQASLIIKNALLINALKIDNRSLAEQLETMRFGQIIGACSAMREVFTKVEKVASTDVSVLISGETGTGKELIAAEIHQRSSRAKGPFVSINCGAIPESLLESELFGHVRGAFTGAVSNRRGKFHAADGGTLFLDEIGELPTHLQVKLLRVLQERTVTRVGDTRTEPVDIRVVTATNKQLDQEIANGAFREDLYYRINVVNIHLPPLRERGDDVMVIAKYLLHKNAEELGTKTRGFSPKAATGMKSHRWPGNIRQLENHVKKAVIMADKPLLSAADLDLEDEKPPAILPLAQAKEEFQRRYINEVLTGNNGNRTKTARDLGVDPRTVFRHLEKEEESRFRAECDPTGPGEG